MQLGLLMNLEIVWAGIKKIIMKSLKLTKYRFLLYLFLLIGSIYSLIKNGFSDMNLYHKFGLIIVLLFILILLIFSVKDYKK